jgi:hypothetical protein
VGLNSLKNLTLTNGYPNKNKNNNNNNKVKSKPLELRSRVKILPVLTRDILLFLHFFYKISGLKISLTNWFLNNNKARRAQLKRTFLLPFSYYERRGRPLSTKW